MHFSPYLSPWHNEEAMPKGCPVLDSKLIHWNQVKKKKKRKEQFLFAHQHPHHSPRSLPLLMGKRGHRKEAKAHQGLENINLGAHGWAAMHGTESGHRLHVQAAGGLSQPAAPPWRWGHSAWHARCPRIDIHFRLISKTGEAGRETERGLEDKRAPTPPTSLWKGCIFAPSRTVFSHDCKLKSQKKL